MEEIVNGVENDDMPWYLGRTSARLLAAQGAYAMAFSEYTSDSDVENLFEHLCDMRTVLELGRIDKKLLFKILKHMVEGWREIDMIISENISEKWSMDRINLISMSIMRAGMCELLYLPTNESIVINEYVKIASSALEDGEIDFVNAMLNKTKRFRKSSDHILEPSCSVSDTAHATSCLFNSDVVSTTDSTPEKSMCFQIKGDKTENLSMNC